MELKFIKFFIIAMLCSGSSLLVSESINAQSEELEMEERLNGCGSDIYTSSRTAECRLQIAKDYLDAELESLRAQLSGRQQELFNTSNEAWNNYVDDFCVFKYLDYNRGIFRFLVWACQTTKTLERLDEIKILLEPCKEGRVDCFGVVQEFDR